MRSGSGARAAAHGRQTHGHQNGECMDRWMCAGKKMKRLSETKRQIVAFIPGLRGSRVMAQLKTRWYTGGQD